MGLLDRFTEQRLEAFIQKVTGFQVLLLWGERGMGKTYSINLKIKKEHKKKKDIIFLEDGLLRTADSHEAIIASINEESDVFMHYSEWVKECDCIHFQNMELCDLDNLRWLDQFLKYCKSANTSILIIMEYNTTSRPKGNIEILADCSLFFEAPEEKAFCSFFMEQLHLSMGESALLKKVFWITKGNIYNAFAVIKILNAIKNSSDKYKTLSDFTEELPNTLFDLYMQLFDKLNEYEKKFLVYAAPFSNRIYSELINSIGYNYASFENYLTGLCNRGYFIEEVDDWIKDSSSYFATKYCFSNITAREAVKVKNSGQEHEIIARYYNYLDQLYTNKNIYENQSEANKLQILRFLAKPRQGKLTILQIRFITELMKYYYGHFMYLNAIQTAECLLNEHIVNDEQLNSESHQFWVIYFESLYSVGQYEKIQKYENTFEDSDLKYYIALTLYNSGNPGKALVVLDNILKKSPDFQGKVSALKLAIYDWQGDSKKSHQEFKNAMLFVNNDENLKFQLYKKMSMQLDFAMPECREKMEAATAYYKKHNLRQYAECLHNYATGCIQIRDFPKAREMLKEARDILNKICSKDIYYPLNSLAMLSCYDGGKYAQAIKFLDEALKYDVDDGFCKMALHNNRYNIFLKMGDFDSAYNEKAELDRLFQKSCKNLSKLKQERPDIQHQRRQYFYNCGLLSKMSSDWNQAFVYFKKANQCSIYPSSICYSIGKNLEELKKKANHILIFSPHIPEPTEFEKMIHELNLYLCEIMFWG